MKKLYNLHIMRATLKISILLLGIALTSAAALSQTQVNGAYGGSKGIFVYLKALVPPSTDNIAYCSIERKETGSNDWKTIDVSKIPTGESDFLKRLKTAIANMPYDVSFIETKGTQIWKTYQKTDAGDSLKMWFGFLPVQEALGVVYHDITAKPGVKYEYKIQQFDVKDKALKTLYYLPAKYPGEKSKWDLPYRNYTALSKQVTVTWGAPGAKLPPFVRVYRQERNGGEWTPASSDIFSSTSKDSIFVSATDAAVTPGAIYRYKLVPMDIFGNPGKEAESDLVAVYNFTMDAPLIQELKATNPEGSKGTIVSWVISRNDLVNSIRLFRSTNYDNGYALLAEVPSTESSYLDQTVEPAKKYFYKITITGPMGELSAASARVFAISDDKSKPLPPVILSATGTSKGILLTINVTENNLSGIRIYRKGEKETDLIPITELLPAKNNTVIWEDTTDISGSRFYGYAAKSENASHFQGDFSEIVYARSAKQVNVPVVMGLTADFYDTYNKLFWTNMQFGETTVEGYIVFRQELPSGTMKQLNDTLISSEVNSYTDRTITERKPYAYSVVLVDEFGNKSRMCNPVSVIPPAIPVIPPSSVAGNSEQTLIRISWNEVRSTTLKEYRVYRYIRGSKATVTGTVPAGSTTEITDKNVTKGQLYFYYITTVNTDNKESKPSEEVSIRKE
jgi:fibronectin type 3 domain-containing protein